jgi:hypothetical protein
MQETTIEHRKQELRQLLDQIDAAPSRDWTEERKRVVVLKQMIADHEAAHA